MVEAHLVAVSLCVLVALTSADQPWEKWPTPPPYKETAQMARYLSHYASWGVWSGYSPEYQVPFGTIQSFVDGPLSNSTGSPYFYISELSDTYKNLHHNNSGTFTFSMAESQLCRDIGEDPEQPPCSRLMLVGKVFAVPDSTEEEFAKKALFSRHPAMKKWPQSHTWNVYKLTVYAVHLQDFYGPAVRVPLKDYFSASPNLI